MKTKSYWEPGMDTPVDCEYLGLEYETDRHCIRVARAYRMVEASCVFDTEWDASERQQSVADASLFNYGELVFYAWKPDASNPDRCKYLEPDMNGKHLLVTKTGTTISARADQIYGVYAAPKDIK